MRIGAGERIRVLDRPVLLCLIIDKLLIILDQVISGTPGLNCIASQVNPGERK